MIMFSFLLLLKILKEILFLSKVLKYKTQSFLIKYFLNLILIELETLN